MDMTGAACMRESVASRDASSAVAAIQRIEIDSIERQRARRLRTRADTIVVPALASMVAIPLSAMVDIR